jgi:hypothetical protein
MSTRIEKVQTGVANKEEICRRCRPTPVVDDMYKQPITQEKIDRILAKQARK